MILYRGASHGLVGSGLDDGAAHEHAAAQFHVDLFHAIAGVPANAI